MNFQDSTFTEHKRVRVERQRNRVRLWRRLFNGLRELIKHPWKLAPLLALVFLCLFVWSNRDRAALTSPFPLLNALWAYTVAAFIALLSVLAFVGLLVVLGTPRQARRIEDALHHVPIVDRYDFPPILVSRQRIKGGRAETLEFYSSGIPTDLWEAKQQKIEDELNMRWIEKLEFGGWPKENSKYIVLTVAKGRRIGRGEPLYDDEL